jgi:hypothetical protein
LSHTFVPSENQFYAFMGDAIGVVDTGTDLYVPDKSLLPGYFATMFVDVADAATTVAEFPYLDIEALPVAFRPLAQRTPPVRWLENADRGATDTDAIARGNHLQLIGGTAIAIDPQTCATGYGDTIVAEGHNVSWVYIRRILNQSQLLSAPPRCRGFALPTRGRNVASINALSTTHELTHQWGVNRTGTHIGGHCSEMAYAGGGDVCLMNGTFFASAPATQLDQGKATLHYISSSSGVDSELVTIRQQSEPIPQQ